MDYSSDPSVPTKDGKQPGKGGSQANYGYKEYCASSSRDVPWFQEDASAHFGEPGMRGTMSVGTIPFYIRGQTPVYPPSFASRRLRMGAKKEVLDDISNGKSGFGDKCTHSALPPTCTTDEDCLQPTFRCHQTGNICVQRNSDTCSSSKSCRCYTHQDCDTLSMCSGVGICTTPVIEIRNEMQEDDAEFRIYSSDCTFQDSHSVNMYGASHWGRVDDILYAHGMCSHRKWFEYNETMASSAARGSGGSMMCNRFLPGDGEYCEFNVKEYLNSWKFTKQQTGSDGLGFFNQGVLMQEAHTCDKDYMHISGMKSCVSIPGKVWWKKINDSTADYVEPDNTSPQTTEATYLKQSNLIRTYNFNENDQTVTARLGVMRHVSDQFFGFMGKKPDPGPGSGIPDYLQYSDFGFQKCNTIEQCYPQTLTVYGHEITDGERKIVRPSTYGDGEKLPTVDVFQCGGFGYIHPQGSSTCTLDMAVAPFYRVLCYSQASRTKILASCKETITDATSESAFISTYCQPFSSTVGYTPRIYKFTKNTWTNNGFIPEWAAGMENDRLGIPDLLNNLVGNIFDEVNKYSGSGADIFTSKYMLAMTCVQEIHTQMLQVPVSVPKYYYPQTTLQSSGTTSTTTTAIIGEYASTTIYRFSQYGLYEYPFSWIVKCRVLVGLKPTDTSVPCTQWTERFDIADALSSGYQRESPFSTWDFLTRVNGGFYSSSQSTDAALMEYHSNLWKSIVESHSDFWKTYFMHNSNVNGMPSYVRTCSNGRDLIKDHVDDSKDLMKDVIKPQLLPIVNGAGRYYTPLASLYTSSTTGNYICIGLQECKTQSSKCGCTQPSSNSAQVLDPTTTMDTIAKLSLAYMKAGVALDNVGRYSFMSSSTKPRQSDMKIPIIRYKKLQMDSDSKVKVDSDILTALMMVSKLNGNFQEWDHTDCRLVNIDDPDLQYSKSCITDDPSKDTILALEEENFPGGKENLRRMRSMPAYLISLMGNNVPQYDWLNTKGLVAYNLYNNVHVETDSIYFESNSVWGAPSMGAMVLNLNNDKLVSLDQFRNRVDSFCGLSSNTLRRTDHCNPLTEPYLQGCADFPEGAGGYGPITYPAQDFLSNSRQTCIFDHTCTISISSSNKQISAEVYGATLVPSQDLYLSSNDPAGTGIRQIKLNELWRWHADTTKTTRFHMPIGVFLESFNHPVSQQDIDVNFKNGQFQAPDSNLHYGMWTMCPHSALTAGTSSIDAGKSGIIRNYRPGDMVNGGDDYQSVTKVVAGVSKYCPANTNGIGTCDVSGFRSYRVGMKQGYVMNPTQCSRTQNAMMVQRNIYKCVGCTQWIPRYCNGVHNCMHQMDPSKQARWDQATYIPQSIKNIVRNGDKSYFDRWDSLLRINVMRTGLQDITSLKVSTYALANTLMESSTFQGSDLYYETVSEMGLYTHEKEKWNSDNPFTDYNAAKNIQYEEDLPKLKQSGTRCSTVTPNSVDYKKCDFDDNYRTVISSVESLMTKQEGLVLKPKIRAAYFTNKNHMVADGIPSWSMNKRDPTQTFVQTLLNSTEQCFYGSRQESVCSVNPNAPGGGQFYVMNPWTGGAFNVFVSSDTSNGVGGCDTDLLDERSLGDYSVKGQFIDTACTVFPLCNPPNRLAKSEMDVCSPPRLISTPTVSASSKHNLCTKKPPPNPTICTHNQGMLQGLKGSTAMDLHSFFAQGIMGNKDPGGLFGNPLMAGRALPADMKYGKVYSKPDEIAGHHVVYAITQDKKLVVRGVPLQDYDKNNAKATVFDASDWIDSNNPLTQLKPWLPDLATSISVDEALLDFMRHDNNKASNAHWTCPLRQVLMWSGQVPAFLPHVPNPQRAERLYKHIMVAYIRSLTVHPTTKAKPIDYLTRLHTDYWTTNGFCVYRGDYFDYTPSPQSEECALAALARSVWDPTMNSNFTTVFQSTCTAQVDWPYTPITGRDNSFKSATTAPQCAVLDRLPVFQYRMRVDAPFQPSGVSTTSKHGTCHMGRASDVSHLPGGGQGCWAVDDLGNMKCPGNVAYTSNKRSIKTPSEMVASGLRKRQLCSQCSAPPQFVAPDGTTPMPTAEVGYGRPFRWEMARKIAGDLRFLLCGNATDCPHIEASEWTMTNFLQSYFKNPEKLVKKYDRVVRNSTKSLQQILDDRDATSAKSESMVDFDMERYMWEENPWVVCNKTGQNCSGTIARQEWVKNRGGTCRREVVNYLANNPGSLSVELDLCNLNFQMDSLCKTLLSKVLELGTANCLSTGSDTCMEKSYFYTPSTFSASNQQFVRDTVREFYRRFKGGEEGTPSSMTEVCPSEDEQTDLLLAQNRVMRNRCGSVALESFKQGLEAARGFIDTMLQIIFDLMNIQTDLMQFMMSTTESGRTTIMRDMMYWFMKLIIDAGEALKQTFTMIFKGIFEQSPMGAILKRALSIICEIIKWIMNNIWKDFACPILQAILPVVLNIMISVFTVIASIMEGINSVLCFFGACIGELSIISQIVESLKDFKSSIENGALGCSKTYNFKCFDDDSGDLTNPALPVATRCWSGYQPAAGDSSALSCSRADTCFDSSNANGGQLVCDACPLIKGEDFMSFACSSLTKRCTCGVQRFERTRCSTHEQCYSGVQGSSCMRMENPFSVAFSTIPCKDCSTQPMCILTSADEAGYCGCPFQVNFFFNIFLFNSNSN